MPVRRGCGGQESPFFFLIPKGNQGTVIRMNGPTVEEAAKKVHQIMKVSFCIHTDQRGKQVGKKYTFDT